MNNTLDSNSLNKKFNDLRASADSSLLPKSFNSSNSNGGNLHDERVSQTILKRLDLVELIADDYLELHIGREVTKCQQKLASSNYSLEEKIIAYFYIIQHYRLINHSLMASSFSKFTEILNSNRNSPQ